jgi:UDP-glucose 4-epimerase
MRVLVTGASGFLGRNVLEASRAWRDWSIVAVYNRSDDLPAFVERHGLSHVTPARCDLVDADAVDGLAREIGPVDATLHLSANGDPAASAAQGRARWDLELNTMALLNVLEHVRTKRMVYISSGAVYDGHTGPVSPATDVRPLLPYAISKLASERYVESFATRRGVLASYANIRFFGAYGCYEPARKITTRFARAVMDGQREFVVRGDGRNLIDFMHVDDAVEGMRRVVNDHHVSGTLDLASGTPMTIDETVAAMSRAVEARIDCRHEGTVPEYIAFRSIDRTMRERFAFAPATAFETGFRRLYEFYRNQTAPAY